jgi:hypothetical protein
MILGRISNLPLFAKTPAPSKAIPKDIVTAPNEQAELPRMTRRDQSGNFSEIRLF